MSEYGTEPAIPDDAPEADVLEQYQSPNGDDDLGEPRPEIPDYADPADVGDQHRSAGAPDEDEYR